MFSRIAHQQAILVRNKIDLLLGEHRNVSAHNESAEHWQSQWHPARTVNISAVTGEGIADLIAAIAEALVPSRPAPGAAVPFTAEHVAALEAARAGVAAHDAAGSLTALQPLLASE
jgi:50S ribosomal subunit-associated GTPase HflX